MRILLHAYMTTQDSQLYSCQLSNFRLAYYHHKSVFSSCSLMTVDATEYAGLFIVSLLHIQTWINIITLIALQIS